MTIEAPFTVAQFTEALEAAVEERGADFAYPDEWRAEQDDVGSACMYRGRDGEPRCIIGLALFKIDPKFVPPADNFDAATSVLERIFHPLAAPRELKHAATAAQQMQDNDFTWGFALKAYHEVLTREAEGSA